MRIKDLSSLTIEQIMRAKRHDFIALESYNTVFKVNILGFVVCALEAYFSGK